MWNKLTGKLDKSVIDNAKHGIAVKYNSGLTQIKLDTKYLLCEYDLSSIIKEYRIL